MKYSEQKLQSWTTPPSDSEEEREENTISMIRSAIDDSAELKDMDIEVFVQGSYANNTNVRAESDVDVCVMLKDSFVVELPDGKTTEDYGLIASELTFKEYRSLVKKALQNKFKAECLEDGNKSLIIHENTYHVNADVVPTFQLRNYACLSSTDPNRYLEGTWFISEDGGEVTNYPKIHKLNGTEKNNDTNYKYKKLVRVMKHIKNNMVDDNRTDGEKISSFLVECLVWNIPNEVITQYFAWNSTVREAIRYLYSEIDSNHHAEWGEVSEMLNLFKGRKWTDRDVKK